MATIEIGRPIPPHTAHAVSVSLPTWKANVGYEEGEAWVLSKMTNGYPRFFIHKSITTFAEAIVKEYGYATEQALIFPSSSAAQRCMDFFVKEQPTLTKGRDLRVLELGFYGDIESDESTLCSIAKIFTFIYPREHCVIAKAFWQHTGYGVSSRRAEFCHRIFEDGHLFERSSINFPSEIRQRSCKGPRRYQRGGSIHHNPATSQKSAHSDLSTVGLAIPETKEYVQFVEERFGRNLDTSLAKNAKLAIRRRIAGALVANVDLQDALDMPDDGTQIRQVHGISEHDIYLYPCGMNSIFNAHQILMATRGPMESVCFGFPYIDTLKVLEKWGPGCLFYGHGSSKDLEDLENRCKSGKRFLAVFCEMPGNPLLKSPDLLRIRSLADLYGFAVVVDETIANFLNVHVLPFADIVVSSLTKVFSGDSNVMGGSFVLNPNGRYYYELRNTLAIEYEDDYWPEDAIFMERNSRDFVARNERINTNTEVISQILIDSPLTKQVYYPKYSQTRPNYDQCRNINGGYGGLLSVTFHSAAEAILFFDALETAKGPSLGTNFTLSSPYVILAHYTELDWAAQFGVEAELVRISVGLEDMTDLVAMIGGALKTLESRYGRRN